MADLMIESIGDGFPPIYISIFVLLNAYVKLLKQSFCILVFQCFYCNCHAIMSGAKH
jgi:hypothetical protein